MRSAAIWFVFLADAFLPPTLCFAQSPVPSTPPVVSVQELALPHKALKAFKKGTALLAKGDPQASLPFFQTVIQLAPAYYGSYHNLGLAQSRLGQLDAAVLNFQKSIDLTNGTFAPSLFGLGMIFYQRADFHQAESLVQRGLFVAPSSGIGKYCLGLVQFSLDHLNDAQRSAYDALRLDPTVAEAHLLLAHIDERRHDPNAVLAEVQVYLKLLPHGDLQDDALALRQRAEQDLARLSASLH